MSDIMPRLYALVVRTGDRYALLRIYAYSAKDVLVQAKLAFRSMAECSDYSDVSRARFARARVATVAPATGTYLLDYNCLAADWDAAQPGEPMFQQISVVCARHGERPMF